MAATRLSLGPPNLIWVLQQQALLINPPSQRLCVDSMGETSPVLKHKTPKLHKLLSVCVCDFFILKQHQPNLNTEMPIHRQTTFRRKFILQAVKMMLSLHHRWWWDWMLHCPDSREKKKPVCYGLWIEDFSTFILLRWDQTATEGETITATDSD